MKKKVLVSIISPPGGGKSTILRALSEQFNIPMLSSGEIARKMQEDIDSEFILKGDFAPEDEMRRRLKATLEEMFDHNTIVLADGFPRFIDQCEWLKASFPSVQLVMYHLDIPYNVCIERLENRNRADDNVDVVKDRLKKYDELTKPIVSHYKIPHYNYDFLVQVIMSALNTQYK